VQESGKATLLPQVCVMPWIEGRLLTEQVRAVQLGALPVSEALASHVKFCASPKYPSAQRTVHDCPVVRASQPVASRSELLGTPEVQGLASQVGGVPSITPEDMQA
jgi:hypothetical protein